MKLNWENVKGVLDGVGMTNMREAAVIAVAALLVGAALASGIMVNHYRDGVWVPCGIAEISPDVPPQLKEWCRQQQRIKP